MSDVEGGSVADSGARLSVGPGSPTQGLKRPASAAFDYTAFEAAGPDLKRPRSPSGEYGCARIHVNTEGSFARFGI